MTELIERLRVIAQWLDQRAHFESEPETKASHSEDADTCRQAVAALEAAREDAWRAMDGLRYAALVWVLSDEIEQSPETVDSAVRRMIRGGEEFRRTGNRAFPAIDQARGNGIVPEQGEG